MRARIMHGLGDLLPPLDMHVGRHLPATYRADSGPKDTDPRRRLIQPGVRGRTGRRCVREAFGM